MRDIKFRAYIKDTNKRVPSEINKIVEVKSLHLGSRKAIIGYSKSSSNYGNYSISFDDIELMQYTGLHDKNGKEIYEGDIVLLDCYYYEEPAFDGEFKVIYDDINGMWLLVDLENKDRGFAFGEIRSYYKAEIEVIGNIYDNPELLGGE